MEKIFLIKSISFYSAIISLVVTIVFLILNSVTAEKVKVNLNKANKKEVLKLDDEDWTKSFSETNDLSTSKSNPKKQLEKSDTKIKSNTNKTDKTKTNKFELKDL
ncbi:MAG: hypothetical protein ACP5O4_00445 [bacterium]|jgi:biopolymer transport protein ExbD